MARRAKQPRRKPHQHHREHVASEDLDPLADVIEYGGELIFAVGFTSGGAPYGPRVEIVDGVLRFPDEEGTDRTGQA